MKLFLDMDDTLCNTYGIIVSLLKMRLMVLGREDLIQQLNIHLAKKDSTLNYVEPLKDLIYDDVLKDGSFMVKAQPSQLVNHHFFEMLKKAEAYHIDMFIISHRKPLMNALRNTEWWLKETDILPFIQDIILLDSKTHPNKVDYIKETFNTEEFILLDDNPLHDLETVHAPCNNLLVYNEYYTHPAYQRNVNTANPVPFLLKFIEEHGDPEWPGYGDDQDDEEDDDEQRDSSQDEFID